MDFGAGAVAKSRIGVRVRGTVQGVGFRPFVHRIAGEQALSGLVRNDEEGVWIEVEGDEAALARFVRRLRDERPPLARVDAVEVASLRASGASGFRIVESAQTSRARTSIPFDCAPCDDCLRELRDPRDRRHRYPFVNCTACGPRYSIVRDVPYDRARTTMQAFTLCARCRAEYEDPRDRRFHAEPNACPECGPTLRLLGLAPRVLEGDAALVATARAIAEGRIVAVKGVGGFLLATDARDEHAVSTLRARKNRPHKPFAVMARDLAEVERVAHVDEVARAALSSPARPIVLLRRREDADVAASVAPGLSEIGVMLPSTPLHVLLLDDGPPLQVMTSGNASDEPIAKDDDDARARLGAIADLVLTHDRAIHTRLDDSVVRVVAGEPQPVRRARGAVPTPIALPVAGPSVLAVGADLKNAVCIAREGEAFLSQHVGDLEGPQAFAFFVETIDKLERLLDVAPSAVAHDLHPEHRSTRWALGLGAPLRRIAVQHHHAHVASCLAEHGRVERAIGVAFDGTGCGPEGDLWGGEFLIANLEDYRRAGHLRPLPLPGGEAAIRAPWRIGVAALLEAGEPLAPFAAIDPAKLAPLRRMIERRVATPLATGAGRWFDAAAAIAGVRMEISYEGQAAIELEAVAEPGSHEPYPFVVDGAPFVVDLLPAIRALAADVRARVPTGRIAARFHETMARVVVEGCLRARDAEGLRVVALSGGCFQNRRLTERALALLSGEGFEVLVHRRVPPNDGGIALGQAAIATARLAKEG